MRPSHPDAQLPNVLLLGDSITRNYFPQVTKDLAGVANVYLMASSTSVGDPRLTRQIKEFAALEKVRFRVVHFNNGMHGWGYTEAQYKAAFPSFLRAVHSRRKRRNTRLASITPVRPDATNGATNPRIEERNTIAEILIKRAGIEMDEQYKLMQQHQDRVPGLSPLRHRRSTTAGRSGCRDDSLRVGQANELAGIASFRNRSCAEQCALSKPGQASAL